MEQNQIIINLIFEGISVKKVRVNKSSPIKILNYLSLEKKIKYIHNSILLLENNTFEFHKINSGSTLIVVGENDLTKRDPIKIWKGISEYCLTSEGAKVLCKLNDLKFNKLETKKRGFIKLFNSYQNDNNINKLKLNTDLNYEKKISTDPLPKIW